MSDLAVAVFAAQTGTHLVDAPRSARYAAFRRTFDEPAFVADLGVRGLRWVARSSAEFPARLREVPDPPPGLFVRGDASLLSHEPAVAIVGARACSPYGSSVAQHLARSLAEAGALVVSGLARGIDGCAHRGALERGKTLAVLGCGIDRDYPRAHASLATQIAETGAIVSEYPPGVEPAPWRFPARNRIVAGLTQATIVVEARERSGALITADLALDTGRDVLAVPGEITSALSRGTNHLLRLGAIPVTCAGDALAVLGLDVPSPAVAAALDEASAAVLAAVSDAPAGVDDVSRATAIPAARVAALLAELELTGLVEQAEGLYREAAR